jgi:deazaflavin-dependent oxidoreductase (nitroreductase family)
MARPPGRLSRLLYRLPLLAYRCRLGRILGRRFLRLEHTGRVSGKPRHTVLEVVGDLDGDPVVAAAFAPRCDWYRNLQEDPTASVTWGRTADAATARFLDEDAAADVLADYVRRHPRSARNIGRLLGLDLADDPRAAAGVLPVVRLVLDN